MKYNPIANIPYIINPSIIQQRYKKYLVKQKNPPNFFGGLTETLVCRSVDTIYGEVYLFFITSLIKLTT